MTKTSMVMTMTATAGTSAAAGTADGGFISTDAAAALAGRAARTIARWCELAREGQGPLANVRIRRLGKVWELHSGDLARRLASAITPAQIGTPTADSEQNPPADWADTLDRHDVGDQSPAA